MVVHCKLGGRSAKAADCLRRSGFKIVQNTLGGVTAWGGKIGPPIPK